MEAYYVHYKHKKSQKRLWQMVICMIFSGFCWMFYELSHISAKFSQPQSSSVNYVSLSAMYIEDAKI